MSQMVLLAEESYDPVHISVIGNLVWSTRRYTGDYIANMIFAFPFERDGLQQSEERKMSKQLKCLKNGTRKCTFARITM